MFGFDVNLFQDGTATAYCIPHTAYAKGIIRPSWAKIYAHLAKFQRLKPYALSLANRLQFSPSGSVSCKRTFKTPRSQRQFPILCSHSWFPIPVSQWRNQNACSQSFFPIPCSQRLFTNPCSLLIFRTHVNIYQQKHGPQSTVHSPPPSNSHSNSSSSVHHSVYI